MHSCPRGSLAPLRRLVIPLVLCALAAVAGAQETAIDYNAIGVRHYAAGEWQEAIGAFSKAVGLAPENPTVRRNLCNAYQASADQLAKKADFAGAADRALAG